MKKTKKALFLAALASSALVGDAVAGSNDLFPTWYVGLRGSVNTMKGSDLGTYPLPDQDWDPGFSVGATAGVAMPRGMIFPLNGLRVEGEVSRYWHSIDNNRTDLIFPIMIASEGEREFTVTSYMINAYYYFPLKTMFIPYVGGGMGKADVELEADPIAPGVTTTEDSVAAWQLMAGLSFANSAESLTEWSLGYKYFTTDDPEFEDGFGGQTVIETEIHSLDLNVRWRF